MDETKVETADDGSVIVDGEVVLDPPSPDYVEGSSDLPVTANIKAVDAMDFAEFKAYLRANDIEQVEFQGSDWTIEDKAKLLDLPFIIAGAMFHKGNKGARGFVAVRAYKEDGSKIVFVDGGTGIRDQIEAFVAKNGPDAMIGKVCRHGLRVSRYDYVDKDTGETSEAETYYLA